MLISIINTYLDFSGDGIFNSLDWLIILFNIGFYYSFYKVVLKKVT